MALLQGLSTAEVRAVGLEALRRWRRRDVPPPARDPLEQYTRDVFSMHGDFGVEFLKLLGERKCAKHVDTNKLKEVFIDDSALHREWMREVLEFVWWLLRAGLAVELQYGKRDDRNERVFPTTLRLTSRGARLLDGGDDNPLLPGFLDRISSRCPGLPDGVLALLVDARACLDHSLLRAAVVLVGVAYEIAISEVVDRLDTKAIFDVKRLPERTPAEKIKAVLAAIRADKIPALAAITDRPMAEASKRAADNAYVFADTLRMRRNEASHLLPLHDFDHEGETEEFLVSAGWHLPGLWAVSLEP